MFFSNPQYFEEMIRLGYIPDVVTQNNASAFIPVINNFLTYLLKENYLPSVYKPVMSSGWRSEAYNKTIKGAAPHSLHIIGRAIDLSTTDVALVCEKNPSLLDKFDLYLESSLDTSEDGGHTHLQNLPPASGKRIFRA